MPYDHNLDKKLLHDLQNNAFPAAEQDIKRGADVNAQFSEGHGMSPTLLSKVAYAGNPEAVEFLIKHHVSLDSKDGLGETILTSLTDLAKMTPEGEKKNHLMQVIDLLTKAAASATNEPPTHVIEHHKTPPRENGIIDDPQPSTINSYSLNGLIDNDLPTHKTNRVHVRQTTINGYSVNGLIDPPISEQQIKQPHVNDVADFQRLLASGDSQEAIILKGALEHQKGGLGTWGPKSKAAFAAACKSAGIEPEALDFNHPKELLEKLTGATHAVTLRHSGADRSEERANSRNPLFDSYTFPAHQSSEVKETDVRSNSLMPGSHPFDVLLKENEFGALHKKGISGGNHTTEGMRETVSNIRNHILPVSKGATLG